MTIRVLIADDNESIHEILKYGIERSVRKVDKEISDTKKEILKDLGQEVPTNENKAIVVDHAYQGEEAVELVNQAMASQQAYDLIIMDVRMPPGIDGIEAIRRISKDHDNQVFVICTAYHDQSREEIKMATQHSKKTYLVYKPFNFDFLKLIVRAVLSDDFEGELELQNYVV